MKEPAYIKRPELLVPPYMACICCGEAFSRANVHTEAGARETQISGMCENCFDESMGDEP